MRSTFTPFGRYSLSRARWPLSSTERLAGDGVYTCRLSASSGSGTPALRSSCKLGNGSSSPVAASDGPAACAGATGVVSGATAFGAGDGEGAGGVTGGGIAGAGDA